MAGKSPQRKKRPTQADVARLAGVSQALVSQILNDASSISIPLETRLRVQDVMNQIGYVPDGMARSLRTRKSYKIACIIPDITNPFYPAFVRSIQDVADSHSYDLITYNTDGITEKEVRCLRSAQQSPVDGIIGVFFHITAEDLLPLLEQGIAVVRADDSYEHRDDLPLDNVYIDNIAAAHAVVQYLLEKGHSRIGMIAGPKARPARVLGYRRALAEYHVEIDEDLIHYSDFREQGGYESMKKLLALPVRPTAVFASNDLMAMGALLAVREVGLHIPRDIAIVGFDDIPSAQLIDPPLTTVSQLTGDFGHRAAEMLFDRLNGTAPEVGRHEEIPFKFIIRSSA